MKGKNILLSALLIAVAVLAGCSESIVYPAVPSSVVVKQTGDFVAGQDFDASKFQVIVTYFNGSTSTLDDVAVYLIEDGTGNDGVTVGDQVYVNVGYDINDNPVEYTGSISRIYSVSNVQVTTAETSFPIDAATGKATVDPSLFTVTAFGSNDTPIVLGPSNYSVEVAVADITSDEYKQAEEVEATATIKFSSNVAKANKISVDPIPVTATKTAGPTGLGELENVNKIATGSSTFAFAALDYDGFKGLPEIDYSKIYINAKYENKTSAENYMASDIEGIELYYVDAATGEKLTAENEKFVNTKLAQFATSATSGSGTQIAIKASYDGVELEGQYTVPVYATTLTFKYAGPKVPAGTPIKDITLDVSDFRAFLEYNKIKEQIAITSDMITVSSTEENVTTAVANKLQATLNYMGLDDTKSIPVGDALVTIQSVAFSVSAEYAEPAAQYYNADGFKTLTIDADDIENFVVTMSDPDEKSTLTAADFTWGFYTKQDSPIVLTDGELDLHETSKLLVGATYQGETYFSGEIGSEVSVTLSEDAEITGIEAIVTPGEMVGSEAKVVIIASNANGAVDKNYTDVAYLDSNGAPTTLDTTVGADDVTYTVYATDNAALVDTVTITAGKGYVDPQSGSDPNKVVALEKKEGVGETINVKVGTPVNLALINEYYQIDADSYKIVEGNNTVAAPVITELKNVPSDRTIADGANNTFTVVISYVGSDGKTTTDEATVSFTGVSYTVPANGGFKLVNKTTGEEVSFVVGKTYNATDYELASTSYTEYGDDTNLAFGGFAHSSDQKVVQQVTVVSDGVYKFVVNYTNDKMEKVTGTFADGVVISVRTE